MDKYFEPMLGIGAGIEEKEDQSDNAGFETARNLMKSQRIQSREGIIIIIIVSGSFHSSRTHVITQSTVSTNNCANVCIMLFVAIKTSHLKAHICLQPQISLLMSTMFAVPIWWPWDWLSETHSFQASGCALGISPHISAASLKAFISVTWSRGRGKNLLHRRSCGFGMKGGQTPPLWKAEIKTRSTGGCIHMHAACWQLNAMLELVHCKKKKKK